MELQELVQKTVDFIENFADENGEPKYKNMIDESIKNNDKPRIDPNDIAMYDKELAEALKTVEKGKEDSIRKKFSKIVILYMKTRASLLNGELPGAELKGDFVFLKKEYIEGVDQENEDKPSIEEIAQYFAGYVMPIDGEEVVVTRFWRFALMMIITFLANSGELKMG